MYSSSDFFIDIFLYMNTLCRSAAYPPLIEVEDKPRYTSYKYGT